MQFIDEKLPPDKTPMVIDYGNGIKRVICTKQWRGLVMSHHLENVEDLPSAIREITRDWATTLPHDIGIKL